MSNDNIKSHIDILVPHFFRGTIIIEAQNKQILREVADMMVLRMLAAPLCGGADPAGACPVRRWPDAGRCSVPCTGFSRFALWYSGYC